MSPELRERIIAYERMWALDPTSVLDFVESLFDDGWLIQPPPES